MTIQLGHPKIKSQIDRQSIASIKEIFPLLFVQAEESIYVFWNNIPIRLRYREDLFLGFNELLAMVWMVQKEAVGATKVSFVNQILFIHWEISWDENEVHIKAKYIDREDLYQQYASALNQKREISLSRDAFLREWNTLLHQIVVSIETIKIEIEEGTERRKWELLQQTTKNIGAFGILYTKGASK